MLEYWSGKEKALVFGLIALAAILAYVVFAEVALNASLQKQMEILQTENSALSQQVVSLQNKNLALIQQMNQSALSASWIERGGICILRLHIPDNPGVWVYINQGNETGAGGYFAIVRLVDDNGDVVVPGVLRFFNTTDPEVWFACRQGDAIGVYATQFVQNSSFYEFILYDYERNRFLTEYFPCEGLCGASTTLQRPIMPKYADVLLFFYPPGVNGLNYVLYDHGYAIRLNVTTVASR